MYLFNGISTLCKLGCPGDVVCLYRKTTHKENYFVKYENLKYQISSKRNRTNFLKIHKRIIYITYNIAYKLGTKPSIRSQEITIWQKRWKNFNLKYFWNLWTNHFSQRTQQKTIQNLPLKKISKRLSQFYSRNRACTKLIWFHFPFFTQKPVDRMD